MASKESTERRDRDLEDFDRRLSSAKPEDRQVECLIELTKQFIELNYILEDIAEGINRLANDRDKRRLLHDPPQG